MRDKRGDLLYHAAMRLLPLIALMVLLPVGHALAQGKPAGKPADPTAKRAPAKAAAPCAEYGAGFLQVAGTTTCVKIGGYMRMESATSPR